MVYVQFYDKKLDGKIDEALGDRSVVILDGRKSLPGLLSDAKECFEKRKEQGYGYLAYSIFKGPGFLQSKRITYILSD